MKFVCDNKRYLVYIPYSIENLHIIATILNINPVWFHHTKGLEHYDLPIERMDELMIQCVVVSSKEIVKIIKGEITDL